MEDHGAIQERDVADRQQNAQLGGTEAPERELKFSQRVSGQVGLDGEQQKPNQQADRDVRMHVSRQRQPGHERQAAEAVDDVVHVEAVARTLLLAHPGQCSVETVSQPVEGQEKDPGQKPVTVPAGQGIAGSRHHLGDESQ